MRHFERIAALALLAAPFAAFAGGGWFASADRQGLRAFSQGDFRRAEALFEDPAWKAAAAYRRGRFEDAARLLEGFPAPEHRYNRATALARAGEISAAIRLYEELLLDHPGHADALHNLAVLKPQPAGPAQEPAQAEGSPAESASDALRQDAGQEAAAPLADDEGALDAPMLPEQAQRWLRQVPDDPGGLLRRKFQRQYRALGVDQDGRPLWPGETAEPW